MSIRPPWRDESDGIRGPQSQTSIRCQALLFPQDRLDLKNLLNGCLLSEAVNEEVDITGARDIPVLEDLAPPILGDHEEAKVVGRTNRGTDWKYPSISSSSAGSMAMSVSFLRGRRGSRADEPAATTFCQST